VPPPAAAPPRFSTRRSLLFSAVIVAGFFVLAEGMLRVVGVQAPEKPRILLRRIDVDITFPFMRPDPDLFWSPRPGFRGDFLGRPVTINELGLRGGPVRVPRPPGRRRVACFGDSITFGYGVGDDETYAAVLGRALEGRGVEALNAGVTGYTSHQSLRLLRRLLPQAGVDVATICIGWNDTTPRPVTDAEYDRRLRALQPVQTALDRLYVYRALKGAYLRSLTRLPQDTPKVPRVPLPDYVRNLEAMVAECRGRGVVPVFVALPHRRRPGEPAFRHPYADAQRETAARLGVPLLRTERLEAGTEVENEADFIDALHLSVGGHREMARLLARQLVEGGLL
jgi:lysophospholipase L1-like esterase